MYRIRRMICLFSALCIILLSACDTIIKTVETPDDPKDIEYTPENVSEDNSVTKSSTQNEQQVLYITGIENVTLYDSVGGNEIGTLACGTSVTPAGDDNNNGYRKIMTKNAGSGYVASEYLVEDKTAVTFNATAFVGSGGASLFDDPNGDIIEPLSPGEPLTILAKTPGGFWRVRSELWNIGYVNVTQLDSESFSENTPVFEDFLNSTQNESSENGSTNSRDRESKAVSLSGTEPGSVGIDTALQSSISHAQAAAGGNWAAAFINLQSGESSYIGSGSMQAASLIKLFIMGAVYENYESCIMSEPETDSLLYSMITVSDNSAANRLVTVLGSGNSDAGRSVVTSYAQSRGYNSTSMGRMLLESRENGDNYTSAADCAAFLRAAYNGEMPHSSDMMRLLSAQTVTHKIPAGVPVATANKTGELDDVQNDAAVVYAEPPYILVVMSENVSSGAAMSEIVSISSDVYSAVTN